jgi:DNA-directed RNA polymerase subunit RPC12/RpoP
MTFVITCPNCGQRLKSTTNITGKKVHCPKCGESFLADTRVAEPTPHPLASKPSTPHPQTPPPIAMVDTNVHTSVKSDGNFAMCMLKRVLASDKIRLVLCGTTCAVVYSIYKPMRLDLALPFGRFFGARMGAWVFTFLVVGITWGGLYFLVEVLGTSKKKTKHSGQSTGLPVEPPCATPVFPRICRRMGYLLRLCLASITKSNKGPMALGLFMAVLVVSTGIYLVSQRHWKEVSHAAAASSHHPNRMKVKPGDTNNSVDRSGSPATNNDSTGTEKWPAAFDLMNPEVSAVALELEDTFLPTLNEEEVKRLVAACGHQILFEESVSALMAAFPEQKLKLVTAKQGYDRRFAPSIENIRRVASRYAPDFSDELSATQKRIRQQMSAANLTDDQVQTVLDEIEKIGNGELVAPVLETLLVYHPQYQRSPVLEFLDGYRQQYLTDGSGKSQGVKLRIEYPASWHAEDGVRPHILQNLCSSSGLGQSRVTIGVMSLPAILPVSADALSEEDLSSIASEALAEMEVPGTTTVDSGRVHVAGNAAAWIEFEGQVNRVGIENAIHGLQFAVVHGSRVIFIGLLTHATPKLESMDCRRRFLRVAPLFQQMLNSVDFLDRYED